MLTDIFANRYADRLIWETFEESDRRFLVQSFRIVEEQLYRYYKNGKKDDFAESKWEVIHARLSTELGFEYLSQRGYWAESSWGGKTTRQFHLHTWVAVCKNFVCAAYDGTVPADRFVKERMSFFEIALRERGEDIRKENETLPQRVLERRRISELTGSGMRIPTSGSADSRHWLEVMNQEANDEFHSAENEFNERLRQAGYSLNFHNGFIQISTDELVESQIEVPFWSLVSDAKWKNVEIDMAEAIDLRDGGGKDPASHAAKALESTIKIISYDKGWTHGGEKGAHNYIENLASSKNGHFIDRWEETALKGFYTDVRNELGHGPGSGPMPILDTNQTTWAIEFCMIWVKSLIERI